MKVSGLTTVRASRHANRLESHTRVNRVASLARRGLTLRSRYRAICLRRNRFSSARAKWGRRLSLMNLRASSNRSRAVSSRLDMETSFGINDRSAHLGRHLDGMNRDVQNFCGLQGKVPLIESQNPLNAMYSHRGGQPCIVDL